MLKGITGNVLIPGLVSFLTDVAREPAGTESLFLHVLPVSRQGVAV